MPNMAEIAITWSSKQTSSLQPASVAFDKGNGSCAHIFSTRRIGVVHVMLKAVVTARQNTVGQAASLTKQVVQETLLTNYYWSQVEDGECSRLYTSKVEVGERQRITLTPHFAASIPITPEAVFPNPACRSTRSFLSAV